MKQKRAKRMVRCMECGKYGTVRHMIRLYSLTRGPVLYLHKRCDQPLPTQQTKGE